MDIETNIRMIALDLVAPIYEATKKHTGADIDPVVTLLELACFRAIDLKSKEEDRMAPTIDELLTEIEQLRIQLQEWKA